MEIKMKIKLTHKTAIKSLICATLLTASQAQAALVDFSVNGTIGAAASGNSWGLEVGNLFTASGQFDDSIFTLDTDGSTKIFDFTSSTNNMTISFGNTVYTDEMDVLDGANMFLTASGVFDGISYLSDSVEPGFESTGFVGGEYDVTGTDSVELELYVDGTWNAGSYTQVAAVPVPAAIWLFGSGLLGLAGIGRRKH